MASVARPAVNSGTAEAEWAPYRTLLPKPATSGAIGYLAIIDNDGFPVGYTISAFGVNNEEVLNIEHNPD
jgi:hypothetical protein